MKKKPGREKARAPQAEKAKSKKETPPPRRSVLPLAIGVAVVIAAGVAAAQFLKHAEKTTSQQTYRPRPQGALTFNKDIAPIIFNNCSGCHRPDQSAPFALLSYVEVKKRAQDIAKATSQRIMPPWLPELGHGDFLGERRLTAEQIGMIQQWVNEGTAEGLASDLPPLPKWSGEWQLGAPDLIVTMPEPYVLAAEGRDVYRNFVIPVSVSATQFVRGVELRPGNPRIVHHAFIKVDRTGQSRRLDAQDAEPGFPGMNAPAEMPDGHFLGWQPGRLPNAAPEGLAWKLEPGADLVLQTHLNPSGKPETLQASIGLYFTDRPPTNSCFKMTLASFKLDIPAGEANYAVEDKFTLPVDVQVLGVLPHAHYLAKEMHGWATLPNGKQQEMLLIKQWDFNWQGDYRYAHPVFLPRGSTLQMRYTYDNSTNNIRNPNHPPKPIRYGPQSSDEMAELWFQLLPASHSDLELLARDYNDKLNRDFVEADLYTLSKNPNDAKAHVGVGQYLYAQNKFEEAMQHFLAAAQSDPNLPSAHYHLGLTFRRLNNLPAARHEFETALRLDSHDAKAHGNLGYVLLTMGELEAAQDHFKAALTLNPDDSIARAGLDQVLKKLGR